MKFVVFIFLALLRTSLVACNDGRLNADDAPNKGRRLVQAPAEVIQVASEEDLQDAFSNLRRGQTVALESGSYALTSTLSIRVRDVALVGDVQQPTVISCPSDGSAIRIRPSNAAISNVTISNLTFRRCRDASAISIENIEGDPDDEPQRINVVLDRVTFQRNKQGRKIPTGDALSFLPEGTLTIRGCTSPPCEGPLPEVEVRQSLFEENEADQGGAIYCASCKLRITDSTFRNNRALSRGGAIHMKDSGTELDVIDSLFIDNKVEEEGSGREISQADSRPIELVTYFRFNFPGNGGGAIFASSITNVSVAGSAFRGNLAPSGGAIVSLLDALFLSSRSDDPSIRVTNSTFEQNAASVPGASPGTYSDDSLGGAIYFVCSSESLGAQSDHNLHNCTFRNNTARYGGAVHLLTLQQNHLSIGDCIFEDNRAEEAGGAMLLRNTGGFESNASTWTRNTANLGGAVLLTNGANFRTEGLAGLTEDGRVGRPNAFRENSAVYGGGIMCAGCGEMTLLDTNFSTNMASNAGGGLYVLDAPEMISIQQSVFESNVAFQGGGVAFRAAASVRFSVVESAFYTNTFLNNTAVVGGGLFTEANRQQQNSLDMSSTRFERNRAVSINDGRFSFGRSHSVVNDTNSRRLLQDTAARDSLSLSDGISSACGDGGGGGMCLIYDVLPEGAIGDVKLVNVDFVANTASMGGGAFVRVDGDDWNNQDLRSCPTIRPTTEPCRLFRLVNVNCSQNIAEYGAAGWFLSKPESVQVGCDSFDPDQWTDVLSAFEDEELSAHCMHFENNVVQDADGEYGRSISSGIYSLLLLNPTSPIVNHTGGETLLPPCLQPGDCEKEDESNGIKIAVKDAFNQTITGGIADAELQVLLVSSSVLGEQIYLAEKGVINVNNTQGMGIGNRSEIIFRYGNLEANLTFSTRECYPGEIESSNECKPCPVDQYSFNTSSKCSDCERNAKCGGRSILIPADGYWHSTPFSPQFHECIIEEACEYHNREDILRVYHDDEDKIAREIAILDEYHSQERGTRPSYDGYLQCSPGYRSILCGSCQAGYGHFAGGECIKCPDRRGNSIFLTLLSAAFAFSLLAINVVLTFNSTRKQIWVAAALKNRQNTATTSRDADEQQADGESHQDRSPLMRYSHLRLVPASPKPSGPNKNERQPLVTDHIIAIEKTTEMGKILINYMQVTRLGLSINVKWPASIKHLLSVLDLVLTTTSGTYYAPLECTFKQSTEGDEDGSDTILALWIRILFPFGFWVLLVIGRPIFNYLMPAQQGNSQQQPRRNATWDPDARPSTSTDDATVTMGTYMTVITLVTFYFSFIDISSEFMKAVNCIKVDEEQSNPANEYDRYALETTRVWGEDSSHYCFEGRHTITGVLGILGLLSLAGTIFLMACWLVSNHQEIKNQNPDFIARYGFIYQGYRHNGLAMIWEVAITLRKGLVVAAVIFASRKGPNLQAALGLGVLIIASTFHWLIRPYTVHKPEHPNVPDYATIFTPQNSSGPVSPDGQANRSRCSFLFEMWVAWQNRISHNVLEAASLLMSISVFYSAIVFSDSGTTKAGTVTLAVVVFILNLLFIFYILYRLYAGLHLVVDMHFTFIESSPEFPALETVFPKGGGPLKLLRKIIAAFKFQRRHRDIVQRHTIVKFSNAERDLSRLEYRL